MESASHPLSSLSEEGSKYLLLILYDLHETQNRPGEYIYLAACKGALRSMPLVKSYGRFEFFGNGICLEICEIYIEHSLTCLLYEIPSDNQVDGLPPAGSTHAGHLASAGGRN